MAHKCSKCGVSTLFIIWSTSKNFPARKLIRILNIKSKYGRAKVMKEGVPVCFTCYNDLMNKRIFI